MSYILCKIVVNDVLNTQAQNILYNIFEDKEEKASKKSAKAGAELQPDPPEHGFPALVCSAGLGWAARWARWLGLDEAQLAR